MAQTPEPIDVEAYDHGVLVDAKDPVYEIVPTTTMRSPRISSSRKSSCCRPSPLALITRTASLVLPVQVPLRDLFGHRVHALRLDRTVARRRSNLPRRHHRRLRRRSAPKLVNAIYDAAHRPRGRRGRIGYNWRIGVAADRSRGGGGDGVPLLDLHGVAAHRRAVRRRELLAHLLRRVRRPLRRCQGGGERDFLSAAPSRSAGRGSGAGAVPADHPPRGFRPLGARALRGGGRGQEILLPVQRLLGCRGTRGVACEEFRSLGEDERGREDLMLRRLAADERWQRCPQCKMFVEKTGGCILMSCRSCMHCYRVSEPLILHLPFDLKMWILLLLHLRVSNVDG
uniref:IBR domain-containing protein n=1 Tax=Ananas comosus var. bracteatus TaxID=296719 RepID=A0A6V7P411_ANACO|nr:unnamed protein product [Ananas comosus var. bracteatus]